MANLPDSDAIRENLQRLHRQLESGDAAAMIGVAKDLLESTAKVVLKAEGEAVGRDANLPSLIARTHETLDIHTKNATHHDPDIQLAVKKIRGGLQRIALGVTDLRNAVGTGHGRLMPSPSGLVDDGRLAAEAAAAWIRSILAAYPKHTNKTI